MDFNESMVTACKYVVDCPADLILALFKVSIFFGFKLLAISRNFHLILVFHCERLEA